MSTFRRYGGLNYSSTNNITRSFISNSDQMNINNFSGLENTKETFKSHIVIYMTFNFTKSIKIIRYYCLLNMLILSKI